MRKTPFLASDSSALANGEEIREKKVDGAVSLKVGMDLQQKVGMKHAIEAGQEIHLKAGMNVVIESGTSLALKVGGNFISFNPAGIFIKGTMVTINSGGVARSGSGCSPESLMPAWRGLPHAAVAVLQSAKAASDTTIQAAEAATKTAALAAMGSAIAGAAAAGSDVHNCATPSPVPPHGPGVVIDGSATVLINNMPACRMGDTLLEAIGPPNKIAKGDATVLIGG